MPKALFCACNFWDSPYQVGSHHLARGLAERGWQVAFVSDPISPAHAAAPSAELAARFALWRSGGAWVEKNIFAYVPAGLCAPHNKPGLRSALVARNWHKLTIPPLDKILDKAGFASAELIYVDSLTQAYWWRDIPHKTSLFRLADNPAGFAKHTGAAQQALEYVAAAVDILLYTSPALAGLSASLRPKRAALLGNGVDAGHFAAPAALPPEYAGEERPVILYFGAMEEWFNFAWLRQAAEKLPHCRFVLIGPTRLAGKRLPMLENISLLGTRPFSALPAYAQHAAAGIIPFDLKRHASLVQAINPLKLYEYMAAGLPVVAGRWNALESLASPAILADNAEEFCAGIKTALANREALGRAGQLFAANFDWETRVSALLRYAEPEAAA